MDSKEVVLLSAAEYFLSRKKQIEQYVEGEHKWFGSSYNEDSFNSRPWYLEPDPVSKTQ
jgi:hypothetical protein